MLTALILLAAMDAAPTPAPTAASTKAPTATPSPTPTAGTGQTALVAPPARESQAGGTRTLADVARERKLGGAPKAGGFSAAGSSVASQPVGQSADTDRYGCNTVEAKLKELNNSNFSPEHYLRARKALSELMSACADVSASSQSLESTRAEVAQKLRDLVGSKLTQADIEVLRSRATRNNVTTTVDKEGTVHTSEQLVFSDIGYVYLHDGRLETVQIR
jgi:hypothetical protein